MNVIEILLIEDSPSDAGLFLEAVEDFQVSNRISLVKDGEEALDFLKKRGRYTEAPTPDLIFLDLNIPRKDGREVLAEIKRDEALRHLPVIIMTTSTSERDVAKCYDLQAAGYIVKPLNIEQFLDVMKVLGDYWLQVVRLPRTTSS